MTRRILVWLVCVTASLIADVASAAPSVPRISWSPCYTEFGPFECGTVQGPLDYSRPSGAAVSIAMIRLPAFDPSRRIGSLFIGWSGWLGRERCAVAAPVFAPPVVLAQFDLVGFDPRGVGRSTALRCFGNADQALATVAPFPFPTTPEEEAIWIAGELELIDSCEQRGRRIYDFMSTADVARDLDLLRQAVGDDQLSYVGYSYGSYLGVTYANLFPDRVRALVVDGVLDPIAWSTGVGNEADTVPFTTRLRSAVGAQPTPLQVILPNGTTFVFTYQLLISNALGAMHDSSSWPSFAAFPRCAGATCRCHDTGASIPGVQRSDWFRHQARFPELHNGFIWSDRLLLAAA